MFRMRGSQAAASDQAIELADKPPMQSDSPANTPRRSGLLRSLSSRILGAVSWSSPRQSVLPTHDEPTPSKRARIESGVQENTQQKPPSRMRPSQSSFDVPRSPFNASTVTPDRHALFARAATPNAFRSRGQLTPIHARALRNTTEDPSSGTWKESTLPRSSWSSLNLGPKQTASLSIRPSLREWMPKPAPETSAAYQATETLHPSASENSVLGKRDPSTAEPDQDNANADQQPSARKRQMAWDPSIGFVDVNELEQKRPKPAPPQNEAERILRALESMRTPLGDARREGMFRSQSMPSWHTSSISVPLPSTGKKDTLAAPLPSSPSRTIAPHSRSLQRARQLRQSQQAQAPSMRSKLRNSVQAQDSYDSSYHYDHPDSLVVRGSRLSEDEIEDDLKDYDDDPMREEELLKPEAEVPVRRSTRASSKAKKSGKPSSKKPSSISRSDVNKELKQTDPQLDQKAAPISTEPPKQHSVKAQETQPPKPKSLPHDNFAIQYHDSPDRKKSVLRQGAPKKNRRNAPSGRITALDDDEQDDMPQADELQKIKLPSELFSNQFAFAKETQAAISSTKKDTEITPQAPSAKPPSSITPSFTFTKPSSSDESSLLNRIGGPSESSTTPAKKPAHGSTIFGLQASTPASSSSTTKPAEADANAQPAASFFGTPPSSTTSSFPIQKNQGPVPNFFGKSKPVPTSSEDASTSGMQPASQSIASESAKKPTSGLGLAAGFQFQPTEQKPSSEAHISGQNAADDAHKTQSVDHLAKVSKADADSTSTDVSVAKKPAAPFSFGAQPSDSKSVAPTDTKSTLASNNNVTTEEPKPSLFTFGSTSSTSPADAKTTKDAEQHVTQPSNSSTEASKRPAFSFGSSTHSTAFATSSGNAGAPSKPAFSFGQSPALFGSTSSSSEANTKQDTKPSFSFAQATENDADKKRSRDDQESAPKRAALNASAKPFSFEKPNEEPSEKPAFGASAQPESNNSSTAKPLFSFQKPAAESSDAKKSSDAPSFQFQATSAVSSPATEKPSFSFGKSAESGAQSVKPSFSFGQSTEKESTSAKQDPTTKPADAPKPIFQFGQPSSTASSTSSLDGSVGGNPSFAASLSNSKPTSASFTFGNAQESPSTTAGPSQAQAGAPVSSTTSFSFTKPNTSQPSFSFGSAPSSQAPSPTPAFGFGSNAAAGSSDGSSPAPSTFSFGGTSNPGSGPNTSASASAPAPFSFGTTSNGNAGSFQPASQPAFGADTSNVATSGSVPSSSPFQFGAGTATPSGLPASSSFAFNAAPAGAGAGAGANVNPAPASNAPTPFAFGAPAASQPSSPAPFAFGTPPPGAQVGGAENLFNMGTSPAPSGRQIKPLRQPRRRN
ncbi:hypothetical protein MYAM1_001424 [Malassezia yamatoensis]|uniref:Uncharacterized protein n=1 Tax=Malassezia yamatoensis TaxID=253288 RepID=A0AAJ5YW48_9BASI|nr:hypothetical protein MYAM1_001424 [Malassezia yamatoensis]